MICSATCEPVPAIILADDRTERTNRIEYEPTFEEITAACLEIQATGDDTERERRRRGEMRDSYKYTRPLTLATGGGAQ